MKQRNDLINAVSKLFNNQFVITDVKEDLEFGNITCTRTLYYKNGKIKEQLKNVNCGFVEDFKN